MAQLKEEAYKGISQRDDAIKKRDEIIKKLKKDQQLFQDRFDEMNHKLANLQRESKLGEEILVNQMKELK